MPPKLVAAKPKTKNQTCIWPTGPEIIATAYGNIYACMRAGKLSLNAGRGAQGTRRLRGASYRGHESGFGIARRDAKRASGTCSWGS